MYKAVIFDFDGTLFDSLPDIVATLNATLEKFGIPAVAYDTAKSYIGNGARELVRLAIGSGNAHRLDEILASYKRAYALSESKLSRFFEGEEEALFKLKQNGVKLAILTNKPDAVVQKNNAEFFARFEFDCVLGEREGVPLKPAPDGVEIILKKLGVGARDCLFVGDGEADVITALNAGMDCVSALWGYRTRSQLEAVGAKTFAGNFSELTEKIL